LVGNTSGIKLPDHSSGILRREVGKEWAIRYVLKEIESDAEGEE
jgi:hypothetical protein